jgi:hypothetical protein
MTCDFGTAIALTMVMKNPPRSEVVSSRWYGRYTQTVDRAPDPVATHDRRRRAPTRNHWRLIVSTAGFRRFLDGHDLVLSIRWHRRLADIVVSIVGVWI